MRDIKLLLYSICKLVGLFRLAQWITRNQLKILCYHGVALADEANFRPPLFITSDHFAQRLAAIRHYGFRVLTLGDAVGNLYSGALPNHAVVITADDGFYSFYRIAVPYLHSFAFPATVYVTTYYVKHANPVFRLVVQYMFWKTQKREFSVKNVSWSADQMVDLQNQEQAKQAMWNCIHHGEQECTEETRRLICEDLGERLGTPYAEILQSRIFNLMTPDELRSLFSKNIDVQLHTHRHTFPIDDEASARRELSENRDAIKQWLATDAHHFCYPSGVWDNRQWEWLESLNVKSSTTCIPGLNSDRTPRHALRRILDGENVHQLEFEAELTGFVSILRGLHNWLSFTHETTQALL